MTITQTRASIGDALQRVEAGAPEYWKMRARETILWCAQNYIFFTADDFWARLEELGVEPPPTKCANGPLFLHAQRDHTIIDTGRRQLSCRSCQHRPLIVWQSALINPDDDTVNCGIFGMQARRLLRRPKARRHARTHS